MAELRLILLLLGIFVAFAVVTYILYRWFKDKKLIKYIPAVVALLLAAYYFYLSTTSYTGFEDIARLILALMGFAAFLGGLITGLFLDYRHARKPDGFKGKKHGE